MAEYIDRNLIEWYGCDYENASCENRECSGCSFAECSHSQVMQIPTADVIEQSKVDKAITEIKQDMIAHSGTGEEVTQAYCDGLKKALEYLENIGE